MSKQSKKTENQISKAFQAALHSENQKVPQLRSNIVLSHKYRFLSSSGTTTNVTSFSLGCAAGGVCTVANTTLTSFIGSLRVNQIEMWSPPAAQGSASTCSVEWNNTSDANNSALEISDTSVSTAVPAHIRCGPPRGSLASFWFNPNANKALFALTAPPGTIIDVSVSLILYDDDYANPFVSSIAAGVLGNTYYLSLDPNATHRFTPVSLTTTT